MADDLTDTERTSESQVVVLTQETVNETLDAEIPLIFSFNGQIHSIVIVTADRQVVECINPFSGTFLRLNNSPIRLRDGSYKSRELRITVTATYPQVTKMEGGKFIVNSCTIKIEPINAAAEQ